MSKTTARVLGTFALSSVVTLARARTQLQDVDPNDTFNCSCTDLSACLAEAAADPCTADEPPTYNQGLHIAAVFIILVASMLGAAVPLLSKHHPFFRIDPFILMLGKSAGECTHDIGLWRIPSFACIFFRRLPCALLVCANRYWRGTGCCPDTHAAASLAVADQSVLADLVQHRL